MDLANMIVPSKTIDIEYPGCPDLYFSIAYLTRDELKKLREKATTQKFSKKTRQPEEEVDNDLFQDLYIQSVVKGWKGFKYRYLEKMIPVAVPEEEYDEGNGLFEFTKENATLFMKNAPDFDRWISDLLEDVENFTKSS